MLKKKSKDITEADFSMEALKKTKTTAKKKFYKRKGFWLIIAIILLMPYIMPDSNSSEPNTEKLTTSSSEENQPATTPSEEKKTDESKSEVTDSDFENYIMQVKEGYLGDYADVSLGEVLDTNHSSGKWNAGEDSGGAIFVDFRYGNEMDGVSYSVAYQFQINEDKTFQLVAMDMSGEAPGSVSEMAGYMESEYLDYYGYTYPNDAPINHISDAPTEDIINGTIK